jgi:nitroreductase
MRLDDVIKARRSVRAFLPTEVPPEVLREVFDLAQWTPSNCNVQPWLPHVVSGRSLAMLRDSMLAAARADEPIAPDWPADGKYEGVYRERQYDAAARLYGAMGVERRDLVARREAYLRNLDFFGAPHAVLVFMQQPFDTREATDIGMYAQTLMLALTSRGVASCAQGALGLYPPIVRRVLDLPDNHRLLFGISFGYEDPAAPANAARTVRAPVSTAVRFHA